MTTMPDRRETVQIYEYRDSRLAETARPAQAETAAAPVKDEAGAASLQRAFAEGLRQGQEAAHEEHARSLLLERERIGAALKKFDAEMAEYYSRIEVEVVKLALAIAAKILHREAQVDSLLVAALARVALDKFYKNTKAVIRVRPDETSGWRQYFAQHMEQASMPEIIEDPTLQPHDCVLETDLGSTELGIETQLKEIENGLFDLLAQRPQPQ